MTAAGVNMNGVSLINRKDSEAKKNMTGARKG